MEIEKIGKAISAIEAYIKKCDYTYTAKDIMAEFVKAESGSYVSYTANDVIKQCKKELKLLALQALRAQLERSNPKPLTLEQLMAMEGKPVWVDWVDEEGTRYKEWRLVDVKNGKLFNGSNPLYFILSMTGITAYPHEPKEEK